MPLLSVHIESGNNSIVPKTLLKNLSFLGFLSRMVGMSITGLVNLELVERIYASF